MSGQWGAAEARRNPGILMPLSVLAARATATSEAIQALLQLLICRNAAHTSRGKRGKEGEGEGGILNIGERNAELNGKQDVWVEGIDRREG